MEGMIDPFNICSEIFFHLHGDPLPQEILLICFLLFFYIFGQCADTLFSVRTSPGTPKILFEIDDLMSAAALPPDFILEKFHPPPTFWTLGVKNIPWLPKPQILTWTIHIFSPSKFYYSNTQKNFHQLMSKRI